MNTTIDEARGRMILAVHTHMSIREQYDREHPTRIASKAEFVEATSAWDEIVRSN